MKAIIIGLLVIAPASAALAGPSPFMLRMLESRFATADVNKDGKLTKAEAKDPLPRVHANFERIDQAKAGFVTLDQIKRALSRGK